MFRPSSRSAPHARTGPRAFARALFAALVVVAIALAWIDPHVIAALPALALPGLLALRRYPGERIVCALATAPRRRASRAPVLSARRPRVGSSMPRGGLLLACSLAVRPPPTLAPAAS